MSIERTYLDYNATALLCESARAAMISALDLPGNASSVHEEGRAAHRVISSARERVGAYVGSDGREIVFTSGATESNNWVLRAPWKAVVTTGVEHLSVLSPAEASGCPVHVVGVDADGVLDLRALEDVLAGLLSRVVEDGAESRSSGGSGAAGNTGDAGARVLVSVQAANSETGVVQPLGDVRRILNGFRGAVLHVDAVQWRACHRDLLADGAPDFVSLSAHKIGGPNGVGALFVRAGLSLEPMIVGGGQELRRRSGTQNVAGIAGFGGAASVAGSKQELARVRELQGLRDVLENGALEIVPSAFVVGAHSDRLCNTTCICVPGVRAETLVMALDLEGFAVSAGSACSSGKVGTSHVLKAMGFTDELAGSAIRVSLGWSNTKDDVARFLVAWRAVTERVLTRRAGASREGGVHWQTA